MSICRRYGLLLFLCAVSNPAWAGLTACPPAGPGTTVNDVSGGCQQVDLQLTNWTVTSGTSSPAYGESFSISGQAFTITNPSGNTIIAGPTDMQLNMDGIGTTPATAGWELIAPVTVTNNGGPSNVCTTYATCWLLEGKSQTMVSTTSFTATVDTADFPGAALDNIALSGVASSHANTTTAVIVEEICAGVASFTTASNCTAESGQYFDIGVGVVAGHNIALQDYVATGTFTPPANGIYAVHDTVYLVTNNGNGSDAYAQFFTGGEAVPEPATIFLAGTALAGIALLRLRKRKARG